MKTEQLLIKWREDFESVFASRIKAAGMPGRLHEALCYAALAPGKRMRPLLVYASGHALGVAQQSLDHAAMAIELIHAYSLVHDDLPAMDDDDLRRGRATVHVAFDEATAILVGDALQSLAFEVLSEAAVTAEQKLDMVGVLARAAGGAGMCGGQMLDMQASDRQLDLAELERLHALKTGALIRAAVRMGTIAARANTKECAELDQFAGDLGLAFQIRDDLLDASGSAQVLGKTAGKDQAQNKSTFLSHQGKEASEQRLQELLTGMQRFVASFNEKGQPLAELARFSVSRQN